MIIICHSHLYSPRYADKIQHTTRIAKPPLDGSFVSPAALHTTLFIAAELSIHAIAGTTLMRPKRASIVRAYYHVVFLLFRSGVVPAYRRER